MGSAEEQMCEALDPLLQEGVTLPTARILAQARAALALADADEPELSRCGWPALRTETLRRSARGLEQLALSAWERGTSHDDPLASRIYDISRRARDLVETVNVYGALAFDGAPDRWPERAPPPGAGQLPALLSVVEGLKGAVRDHRAVRP